MAIDDGPQNKKSQNYSRRKFLAASGAIIAADALVACTPVVATPKPWPDTSFAPSNGYLVYDSRKCAGCVTCMLVCSLVHEGQENLSLARIQIAQSSFGKFPDDIKIAVCRQCVTPVCVQNCPTGACYVDGANGNVRRINSDKCIGCKTCISACPQQPNRTVWNPAAKKSTKCDLCTDSPHWVEKGGVKGKQACVESCPMHALKLVRLTPDQTETDGYDVNLRNENWLNLGLVDNMSIVPPAYAKAAAQKSAPTKERKP
jgi:protein NrfC